MGLPFGWSIKSSYKTRRLGCQLAVLVQAPCATKSMEYEPFDLAGKEGIIVVSGGNIEHGQERVASANTAHVTR